MSLFFLYRFVSQNRNFGGRLFSWNILFRLVAISETMWLEECNDLIRSCGQISTALGIQKSFSTSDITQILPEKLFDCHGIRHSGHINTQMRPAISELVLNSVQRCGYMLDTRLTSRSCSTWVAVGELASTSQLPSPHGYTAALNVNQSTSQQQLAAGSHSAGAKHLRGIQSQPPPFTAADFVRSVNKKVRENYIKSRLLTTYRAIERLSQSEFNLDQLATIASTALPTPRSVAKSPGPTELIVPSICAATAEQTKIATDECPIAAANVNASTSSKKKSVSLICPQEAKSNIAGATLNRNLTIEDIEKERGRPLSKYDRNMMIFNWLHNLDATCTVEEYE